MKKNLLLLTFIPFLTLAQKFTLNYPEMKQNLEDPASRFYAERLIYKFKGLPQLVDDADAHYLYYGLPLVKTEDEADEDFHMLGAMTNYGMQNYEKAVEELYAIYVDDPTNLQILALLFHSYSALKDRDNTFFHFSQLKLLLDAIRESGDGETQETPFLVNSFEDEKLLMEAIKGHPGDFQRQLKVVTGGVLATWTAPKDKVFIKVLNDPKELPN